jgi:hypothetical protein
MEAVNDALVSLQGASTDENLWARLALRLDNLEALLQADPALAAFVPQLQAIQAAAAQRDLATVLALSPDLFADIATVVAERTEHLFATALAPWNVNLQPGESTTFGVRVENQGTATTTVALSIGALPDGVTATVDPSEITLAPGEVRDASSPQPAVVTLDQSLVSTTLFTLEVIYPPLCSP